MTCGLHGKLDAAVTAVKTALTTAPTTAGSIVWAVVQAVLVLPALRGAAAQHGCGYTELRCSVSQPVADQPRVSHSVAAAAACGGIAWLCGIACGLIACI